MRTKSFLRIALGAILVTGISLVSCKKDKEVAEPDTTSLQQLSKDQQIEESMTNEVFNDVNAVLSNNSSKSTLILPCNATIDSSTIIGDTIIYSITYNGLSCNGKFNRTGNVIVKRKINEPWKQAGAKVIVKYNNLVITRVLTNKTFTLNGTKTFQNVSGGTLAELESGNITSLVHKVTGSMLVTFENNSTRTWNIARQRTFTKTQNGLVLTIDGFGTSGNYTNLVVWGTNRHGEAFYTRITQSIVLREACSWDPVAGVRIHEIPSDNKSATITFGYNNNNQPISNGECPTRYKVDWVKNGKSGTIFLSL